MRSVPAVLRHRDFRRYWLGVVLSQIGTRGVVAANLYQVYELTGSTLLVGGVGAAQAVALLVLSPLGGVYADRLDRRRLLQVTQTVAMLVAVGLALLTATGQARAWHVFVAVLLTTAAATFDQPARQALIPAMVPRQQLPEAIALLNPSRELAILVGPAIAGVLIAASGPEAMYFADAASYAVLVVLLASLRIPRLAPPPEHRSVLRSLRDGAHYVRGRPLIWQLMVLAVAMALGLADALATTIRHAAVQLETPDELRSRVQGFYQMSSRGGPAIGDVNLGWLASVLGPVTALTLGGLVSVALGGWLLARGGNVRDYEVARPAPV